jgi:hypothetical protein
MTMPHIIGAAGDVTLTPRGELVVWCADASAPLAEALARSYAVVREVAMPVELGRVGAYHAYVATGPRLSARAVATS